MCRNCLCHGMNISIRKNPINVFIPSLPYVHVIILVGSVFRVPSPPLKGRSFGRLSQSSVLIRAHFHTDTLQDLFDPHIAVPVSHGWQFLRLDGPCSRIDTAHVDFGNKADLRRDGGIFVGTVNSQLVKSAIVVGLSRQWLRQQN
jgi:hypothetical protein